MSNFAFIEGGGDGTPGPQGEPGETGPQGPKGDTGDAGANGSDASVTWTNMVSAAATANTTMAINEQGFTQCTSINNGTALNIGASTPTLTCSGTTTTNIGTASNTNSIGKSTATNTIVGTTVVQRDGTAVVASPALTIQNTTPAISGTQQAVYLKLVGQGWKTISTAASQEIAYYIEALPIQSSANPNQQLYFLYQVNGGSINTAFYHDPSDNNFGNSLHSDCFAIRSGGPGIRFDSPNNHGGFDIKGSGDLRLKSYNTKGVVFELGADSGGSSGVESFNFSGARALTITHPVSIINKTVWGAGSEQKTSARAQVTSASDTVIVTYAATDETIFRVKAVFLMWLNNTDYAVLERYATFYRDGGTLTQLSTTLTTGVDQTSAGFATVNASINASGTNIRGIANGVAATSIETCCFLTIYAFTP